MSPYIFQKIWLKSPCKNIEVKRIYGFFNISEESMNILVKLGKIICTKNMAKFIIMIGSTIDFNFILHEKINPYINTIASAAKKASLTFGFINVKISDIILL